MDTNLSTIQARHMLEQKYIPTQQIPLAVYAPEGVSLGCQVHGNFFRITRPEEAEALNCAGVVVAQNCALMHQCDCVVCPSRDDPMPTFVTEGAMFGKPAIVSEHTGTASLIRQGENGFIYRRLPVRFTFDNNYFNALYQGIPIGGYTAMVERMLRGIEVRLNTDYLQDKAQWDLLADKVVYTGPIDRYFGYRYGNLEYRSVRFDTEILNTDNFQGNAVVNYTDPETPYTRIIEHKHFEFGTQPKTVISREYSQEWTPGEEPYYPVNDDKNSALYAKYKAIADSYAEKYPDIVRVIHQENGGHGEGINQGLKHATGTYFKVVDSDDTLSSDFPAFLDALEQCEAQGGVDLAVTNYFYVHTDGIGDRAINYSYALPEKKIFGWKDTKPFHMPQMLTIHSCTFRTELMRRSGNPLPKHVFYEDNLMVYQVLPNVRKMFYMNADLYRYWIGRPDQSVQQSVSVKRYTHQILVTEKCFTSFHLDDIEEAKLKKYLKHELFMMFGISISFTRLNKTAQSDADLEAMWKSCIAFDPKWGKHFRYYSPLILICIPGRFGWGFTELVYRICNKIVRFN